MTEKNQEPELTGKKVLFVDDEKDLAEVVELLLLKEKCIFDSCTNITDAYAKLQAEKFDIVITDMTMQGGSGLELIEKIKAEMPDGPVCILLTGQNDDKVIEQAYSLGAALIVFKPISRKDLVASIRLSLQPAEKRWQRRSARAEVSSDVTAKISLDNLSQDSQCINVSVGGMFIAINDNTALPASAETIQFDVKAVLSNETVELSGAGIVRWVRRSANEDGPRGIGVEFSGLDAAATETVSRLVADSSSNAFIPNKPR